MRKLRAGDIVRVRSSPTELSEDTFMISNINIHGIGGLTDITDPAHLVLLVHSNTFQTVLAYYVECELVG